MMVKISRSREEIARDYYLASGAANSSPTQETLDRIDKQDPIYLTPAEKLRAEGAMNALEVAGKRILDLEEALKAALWLADLGEVPAPLTIQRWRKLL